MSRPGLSVFSLFLVIPALCSADLTGSQVTGSATLPFSTANQFDPSTLSEPSYCGNTSSTTIAIQNEGLGGGGSGISPVQYTFCAIYKPAGTGTGAPPATAVVAQFTSSGPLAGGLIIQVSLGSQPSWTPFQLTFSDSDFAGLQLFKYSDNFLYAPDGTRGISASLTGSTITIKGGVPPAGGVFDAAFALIDPSGGPFIAPPSIGVPVSTPPAIAWSPQPGAQAYTVWVGADQISGSNNLFYSWALPPSQTSMTLPFARLTGDAVYALWVEVNGEWTRFGGGALFVESVNMLGSSTRGYLGYVQSENILYPLDGATNVDPFKPFIWTTNGFHDGSTLTVGTTPGASDVFNSGTLSDTDLSHPVEGGASLQIPGLQPNTTYFARLTGPAGWNTPTDVQFTTGVGKAHLISPADEAQQVASGSETFTINPVQGAQQYVLWLGITPGGSEVGQGWFGPSTSANIVLAPNAIYYARTWTQLASGEWTYVDSRFSTYTTDVAFVSFPANGEMHALAADSGLSPGMNEITIGWNPVSAATGYTTWVGTSPGANDVLNTWSYSLTNNMVGVNLSPADNTKYYVRLWTNKGSQWYYTDSAFSTYGQTLTSPFGSDPQ